MKKLFMILMVVAVLFTVAAAPLEGEQVDLQQLLYDAVSALVKLAVAALSFYAVFYADKLLAFIKAKVGDNQYNWLAKFASTTVDALAQNPALAGLVSELTPEKLQKYAVEQCLAFAKQYKLPFTEAQIVLLVEEAVKALSDWPPPTEGRYSATKILAEAKK